MSNKIVLQDSQGRYYNSLATYEEIFNWIKRIDEKTNKIDDLEKRLNLLEKPIRLKAILDFMAALDRPRTWGYIKRRVPSFLYWEFMELVDFGKIQKINLLYQLKKES